jgi:hypothetical protein
MLLSVSSALFEDPAARRFVEQLQRVTGSMFRLATARGLASQPARESAAVVNEMADLQASSDALLQRLPSK